MTPDEAYAAINHLRSVLLVPRRDEAHKEGLGPFHKSFIDYNSDFRRSGFSSDIQHEAQQIQTQCAFRILNEAPNGCYFGYWIDEFCYGCLAHTQGSGDQISLTWPTDKGIRRNDKDVRCAMYMLAIEEVAAGVKRGDPVFQTELCIRLLTTQFRRYYGGFPHCELRDLAFVSPP
jgi:hypothetical protein